MVSMIEKRMAELISTLNAARQVYYEGTKDEYLSNREYDKLFQELIELEKKLGICLHNTPTSQVGFEETGKKIKHCSPMLSLKHTKNVEDLLNFIDHEDGILSWKLDGVSVILYYEQGVLIQAVSRGDGHYGKDITKNVKLIQGVPNKLRTKTNIVIRGEGCIYLKDFERIKKTKQGEKFSNPRNLVSGLINATRSSSILLKSANFTAHSIVSSDINHKTYVEQLDFLQNLGFVVVPYFSSKKFHLKRDLQWFTDNVSTCLYPVDGLVLRLNDISRGDSLGSTARFPKHSLAFKWPDEVKIAEVTGMDWSVSSTGLITPVVIFKPITLEGTTIRRANLYSLKIFEDLGIGMGDKLEIYKANKIIPTVAENLTRSKTETFPKQCPVCGSRTKVLITDKTKKLYCSREVPWKCTD